MAVLEPTIIAALIGLSGLIIAAVIAIFKDVLISKLKIDADDRALYRKGGIDARRDAMSVLTTAQNGLPPVGCWSRAPLPAEAGGSDGVSREYEHRSIDKNASEVLDHYETNRAHFPKPRQKVLDGYRSKVIEAKHTATMLMPQQHHAPSEYSRAMEQYRKTGRMFHEQYKKDLDDLVEFYNSDVFLL